MTRVRPPGAGKLKLGVLASGRGSNFEALHDSILNDNLPAIIQVVITDQPQAPVLEKAKNRGIPGYYVNPAQFEGRQPYEAELVSICRKFGVELVVLAGFMRILRETFIQAFPQRVINVHPSLLPSFAGLHAHRQALDYGVKFSGCTVHFVDLGVDTGPVILQQAVPVMQGDDEESLADRILQQEHLLLPQAVRLIAEGRLEVCRKRVNILPKEESTVNKRALVSVSNKEGVVDFAQGLEKLGWDIISTGGTYELLKKAGVKVSKVADVTGFPEILDGRVKTLHPKIHGGILARRIPNHMQQLAENAIEPIDMVAVNLYPFRETIKKPGVELEEAIENIDIGGPTMIRSAAKNYQDVLVVVSPDDYTPILEELSREGGVTKDLRFKLAHKAFAHTAFYDSMIADYLGGLRGDKFPDVLIWGGEKLQEMRYGENPHQGAAFYRAALASGGLPAAKQLNGKELSYNNVIDAEAAYALVREFDEPACVIIKHTNPCGAAIGGNLEEAWDRAFNADPVSAFGGIIAFNREVDQATAKKAAEPFMEVIIAPGYEADALATFQSRKNLRVLELDMGSSPGLQIKSVVGGMVVQDLDTLQLDLNSLKAVTNKQPNPQELQEMLFAWKVVKHVKSNAIVVTREGTTLGVGAGQMNRVGSAKLALEQAGERSRGAVLASDAFFPFKDTVELAGQYGISAIIQTGGSVRDQESIDECDRLGMAMVFTNVRHFRH